MKKKIYDIVFAAQYEGLTTKEATDKLLLLFSVSSSATSKYDISSCPECKSVDHTMITGQPYKCMDCGHKWV